MNTSGVCFWDGVVSAGVAVAAACAQELFSGAGGAGVGGRVKS